MLVQWFNSLPVASQAALIGAAIGALAGALANIVTGVLRDFVAKWWTETREAKKSADEVYRRYAEPLASAVTSLLWRLKETLGRDGRASYLSARDPKTVFEEYKLRSTYYRLAAVLGWVRALRRELSVFREGAAGRLDAIEDAISNLEGSLADGHHVELQRLDGLLQIWGLPPIRDSQLRLRVAVDVENCSKRALQGAPVTSAIELPADQQTKLCGEIAEIVCFRAALAPVSSGVLAETQSRAIRQIAIREAWLYRDWQAAIGDIMLRETLVGTRRFEVVGFGEFETMLLEPTEAQSRSLGRIAKLFDQLDVDRDDLFDARPAALRKLYKATARMVSAISQVSSTTTLIDTNTRDSAIRALELPSENGT